MSVIVTFMAIVATVGFLVRDNRKKTAQIKGLEREVEQLNKMILKYGKSKKTQA
jgi:hypothetical protein